MAGLDWRAWRACLNCGDPCRNRLCRSCTPGHLWRVPQQVPGIRSCWTLSVYEDRLGDTVRAAKQPGARPLAIALSERFAERMMPLVQSGRFSSLIAVPSPWTRRWKRGFHLPSLLARALSSSVGLPVSQGLKITPGRRQAGLHRQQRLVNLKTRLRSTRPIEGRVLLIDDIWTTGATAQACAKELLGDRTDEVHMATLCVTR